MALKNKCLWVLAGLLIFSGSSVVAQNAPADIPPADGYRQLSCEHLSTLLYSVSEYTQQGKTPEEIYALLTPPDAVMRVKLLHGNLIPAYSNTSEDMDPSMLAMGLQQYCLSRGLNQAHIRQINQICNLYVNYAPKVVSGRDEGKPYQDFVSQLTTPFADANPVTKRSETEIVQSYIYLIYSNPDKTVTQLQREVGDSCYMSE